MEDGLAQRQTLHQPLGQLHELSSLQKYMTHSLPPSATDFL